TYYICVEARNGAVGKQYGVKVNYSVSTPSNLKVSTRNRTSLKLSWSSVSNAGGYQLQQKIDGTWVTKVITSSTYTTISNLTPGKNYYFRVRAYRTVNGKKYYSLYRTLTTCTKPATVTLSGLTRYSSGHKIKASWKKVSGYASGYQIYWSRNSSFSNVVAKTTVSGQSTTSYTGKNFTKGRRYYVKVRAYKTVNGTKYYGSWSNVKSIVCK
ncbi:MAG: fibronectin type III domain-containing protein, partial [Eubacterium sp.]